VVTGTSCKPKSLHGRIVSGSFVLLTGSALTSAINLAYNVIVASFLGPAGFGHATVLYTLLIILSAVALAFQIVSAKVVAQQKSPEGKSQCYRVFHRAAWGCGLMIAVVLLLFRESIATYLNLPDPLLVALLAIGAGFFVPLGCRRGWIQGTYGFRNLSINLVLEGAARLSGSYFLIVLGYGVRGVIAANAAAIAVAYFAIVPKLAPRTVNPLRLGTALRETGQALSFYAGQMFITNFDIVLVKHLFSAEMAGLFAAVALVGRVISTLSSAVVNTMFPIVAGTGEKERKDLRIIATSLLMVLSMGAVLAIALRLTPNWVWAKCLGAGFATSGANNLSDLAALYAIKSVVYSLSVVFITFEMSYKIANSNAVQLFFSVLLIAGVYDFHSSLHQVILVELVLLSIMVVFSAIPFFIDLRSGGNESREGQECRPVQIIRRVSEDEVIAEFLRSDFNDAGFRECPANMREMIIHPNLEDATENTKRRALMLLRHLSLWNELPEDTAWYEVKINEPSLEHVRVFPRAQWRKLARGNFSVTRIVEDIRNREHKLNARFIAKIQAIRKQLAQEKLPFGAVLLLGVSEDKPVTLLDGNHRLVAAMTTSADEVSRLRFMCGLSSRMEECCWYDTNFATLFRYARHLFEEAISNPRAELRRVVGAHELLQSEDGAVKQPVSGLIGVDDIQP